MNKKYVIFLKRTDYLTNQSNSKNLLEFQPNQAWIEKSTIWSEFRLEFGYVQP